MLESLIVGIILALISGLTFLAYKHHDDICQIHKTY